MQYDDVLAEKVRATFRPIYRRTKAEVIEGYQEKYEGKMGKGGWKQQIIHDVSELTGQKPTTVEKRFDKQRRDNPEPRNRGQYEELGRKLKPLGYKAPSSFTVKFHVDIRISGECGNIRGPYSVTITGEDAKEFARNPTWDMVMAYYWGDKDGVPEYDHDVDDICHVFSVQVY